MLKKHSHTHSYLSVCTEWMKFSTELGIFSKSCLLLGCLFLISLIQSTVIRTSSQQVIHFYWKAVFLCQHTGCLEKYCQKSLSHGAFSWALVTATENIYMQYAEIVFYANTGRAQWSLEQYHGYQFCLDSPDWHFQLFYVPSATRKHKMIFLFLSEQFRLSPNFSFTRALSMLFYILVN